VLRLLGLGVFEAKRPELCPLFFQTDLVPPIQKILSRDGSVCFGESMERC
jgi:hypothetical protein